jgi:RNA polymerase sigma factor (sigma-70 family)
MNTDGELLRRYAEHGDEAAFAEVVRRQVDLVHSAAVRLVGGDPHLAQDVTQAVFTALARQARGLARRASLAGWLHTTARYIAAKTRRGERRRFWREQEAFIMNHGDERAEINWDLLRPALDEAVGALNATDREAVLLRFFQNKSHQEVGEMLGLNEDTARKRVERALEKLRAHFGRRGVTVSAGLLAEVIAVNSVQAAPAGLAASVAGAALAGVGSGAAGVFEKIFAMTTKTKIITGAAVVIAVLVAMLPYAVERREVERLTVELQRAKQPAGAAFAGGNPGEMTKASALDNFARLEQIMATPAHSLLLLNFMGSLNATEAKALFLRVAKLTPNLRNRWIMALLMNRLGGIDPQGGFALANMVTLPGEHEDLLDYLFDQWSSGDYVAALAAASSIPNEKWRTEMTALVLKNLANSNPQAGVAVLQTLAGGAEVSNLYTSFFSTWGSINPTAAAAAVLALPATRDRNAAIVGMVNGWAESDDPQAVLAWASNLPVGDTRTKALSTAITGLTAQDPVAALNFASNITIPADRDKLTLQVVNEWGQSDPQSAMAWVEQSTNGTVHDAAVASLLGPLSLVDRTAALNALAEIPAGPQQDEAINQMALANENDPQADLTWLLSQPNSTSVRNTMSTVVNLWVNSDPDAAQSFIQTIPQDNPVYSKLMATETANRFNVDPNATVAWAQALPADQGHDLAVSQVIAEWTTINPSQAWSLAQQLPSSELANKTALNVVTKWAKTDPTAAASAVQGASLNNGQRQTLLSAIQSVASPEGN